MIYQLEVTPAGDDPGGSQVQVSSDTTFARLHEVLQAALGGEVGRYRFVVGEQLISELDQQASWFFREGLDAAKARLQRFVFPGRDTFSYVAGGVEYQVRLRGL